MHRIKVIILLFLTLIVVATVYNGCQSVSSAKVNIDHSQPPFANLSEYHFFKGEMKEMKPNERVLPYDLNTPLFSDYAEKTRFVWMPEGESARYNDTNAFEFPLGAVLIKTFYYPNDFRDASKGRKIMETRLLVNRESGWDGFAYIWNDEQTEAVLEVAGGKKDISWVNSHGEKMALNYVIPNKNQCKGCHTQFGKVAPIGPKARNLNKNFEYAGGVSNQMDAWQKAGYLVHVNGSIPRVAIWNDEKSGTIDERARAYLDVNCAHCHRTGSPAATSGLRLDVNEKEITAIGFCKSPVAAGRGAGNLLYDIVPGQPEQSILHFRMNSDDPGVMMPELGRKLIHTEGVELIRKWISELKGNCKEI